MSWQTLLTERRIKTHSASKQELNDLRAVVARDLADVVIAGLSADRRFATAYNAALPTATMAIACAGYRTSGTGNHQTTFEAAEPAQGTAAAPYTAYFESCRRKRSTVDDDRAHVATETEAAGIVTQTTGFLALVEAWISQNYPPFKKT